jgi:hypothetical protein
MLDGNVGVKLVNMPPKFIALPRRLIHIIG